MSGFFCVDLPSRESRRGRRGYLHRDGYIKSYVFKETPDGIVLFGILMWIYARRREEEDIESGIVEVPAEDIIRMPICKEFVYQ